MPDSSGLFQDVTGITAGTFAGGVLDIFFRNLQTLEMLEGQVLYLQPYVIEIE
jgi:hypothetical protein